MIKIKNFETTNALLSTTEELLRATLLTPGNLMLSGGATPYVIYNRIATAPCPTHPDRKLFLSDERMASADSPKNNACNLMPMIKALNCGDRFIRVDTRLSIENAASQFATALQPLEKIDLGFLGMGADGHTAGFFTSEQAHLKSGSLTLYTNRPDGMQGVSITPALLKRVERIILLVTGESKRDIIDTLLSRPETIPVGIALADHINTELWTDLKI